MSRARLALVAGAVATALAGAFAQSAWACTRGYSYAGLYSSRPAVGVAASLSMLELPTVTSGHVAAWVGVGGPGLGPNGADEWLQVGLASFDSSTARLYYELTLPGREPEYVELASGIEPGRAASRLPRSAPAASSERGPGLQFPRRNGTLRGRLTVGRSALDRVV